MPEINIDDKDFESYKQCEIRRPSEKGYYFDVIWIKADLARKNNLLEEDDGTRWTVHEVYGTKKLPSSRKRFKQVVP